jgi:surface polysaccharide O-acyltransferase-like enzyme
MLNIGICYHWIAAICLRFVITGLMVNNHPTKEMPRRFRKVKLQSIFSSTLALG